MGSTNIRLTDARIRALRAKANRYEVWDTEPGFGLRIAPSGRKSFVYVYRFDGKPRRMTIGAYPRVSLADARESVGQAIKKLGQGVDPGAEKIAATRVRRNAETFSDLAHEWIEHHAKPKLKTWQEAKRQLEADAIPAWGRRKAKEITRRDVIALVDGIMDRGSPIMANRTLGLLKQIFKFGVQRDILDASPAVAIDKPGKEIRRDRVLSEDEIRTFWHGLDKAAISSDVRTALRLCLVTGQRRGEIAGLRRGELNDDLWTLPAERSKNGKAHRIPLTTLALELVNQASGDDYLFPSPRHNGSDQQRPIRPWALTNALNKNRNHFGPDRFKVHDLRLLICTEY